MARVNVGHQSRSQRSLKLAAAASLALLLVASALLLAWTRVQAVGVVTNCANDLDLSSKLAGGGAVTFNCGAATIVLSSAKTISADATIDGGGLITLSGGNADRLFVVDSNVTLTLNNIVLTNGYADADGGAIFNNGHLILNKATIQNSQTTLQGSGGAIVTYGPLEITDSTLANNKAANGGAIYPRFPAAQVTITRSALHDNQTTSITDGWGGAILLWDGAAVSILNSDLYSNTAINGGAIFSNFANSSMSLQDTQVRNNSAFFDGGGIYNENGTANLTDVTLSGNSTASLFGGGIYNKGSGTATLTNVTLSANSSYSGAIYNTGGTAILLNATLSSNSADGVDGVGGIANVNAGHLRLKNVIVATSSRGNCDFSTAPDSSLFNLSSDYTCAFGAGRDNVNVMLGLLADNGGPTLTHMPLPGSPAIDNGTGAGCPATDQRGAPRPFGAACDVGSVEYGAALPATPTPVHTPTPSPSPTPIATLSSTPSPSPSPTPTMTNPPHKQGDLDCNNVIDGRDALRPVLAAIGLPMAQPGGCPSLDFGSPMFGDVTCDTFIGPPDTIAILEYAASVAIKPTPLPGCTPIGSFLS